MVHVNSSFALLLASVVLVTAAPLSASAASPALQVTENAKTGQVLITESGKPVLQYNYKTIQPPEGYLDKIRPGSQKYAVPRSNYIHPLYGPDGEVLTEDWSLDHPHHRGIYWAWPEVDYAGGRADLHALQGVFARPTGKIEWSHVPGFALITAESVWKWEDKTPIVRELTSIRAHPERKDGRRIDLTFEMTALVDGVTLARRGTKNYGGLNIRLSQVKDLRLIHHADPDGAAPRRAWSDSIGIRPGGSKPVGFGVFEKATNPDYPGDWIKYPKLPWFQPAFPAAGTRYSLNKDKPLVLKYRLWIRRGGETTAKDYANEWDAFN